jgi:hypothetical protein
MRPCRSAMLVCHELRFSSPTMRASVTGSAPSCGAPRGGGRTEGFVPLHDPSFIGGSNLTATKARLLLMACLTKFGNLPSAASPDHPTSEEAAAIRKKVAAYQTVFDTH